jgi:hypothetical protein
MAVISGRKFSYLLHWQVSEREQSWRIRRYVLHVKMFQPMMESGLTMEAFFLRPDVEIRKG